MISLKSTAFYSIVGICIILIAVNYFTIRTTSAVRAYINGESQYSKGQKDATNHLILYINTGELAYWEQFNIDIQIPLGDGIARRALLEGKDHQVAKNGFLQGKNHIDDVDDMIWLFRYFSQINFMKEAIDLWGQGDLLTEKLYEYGKQYRTKAENHSIALDEKIKDIKHINRLSTDITILADKFSGKLGTAARKVNTLLLYFNTAIILLIIGVSSNFIAAAFRRLRSANEFKKKLMDASFEASIWYDKDSRISFWNPQAEKTFGWKRNEIIGRKLTDTIIPKEYEDKHIHGIQNYLQVGTPPLPHPRVETVAQQKDGTIIPIELSIMALKEGDEAIFCANIFDISEKKHLASQEEKRASYLHAILNSTDDGILATSIDGHIIEANQRFADLWNIPLELVTNTSYQSVADLILVQIFDPEKILEEVMRLFTTREVHTRLVYCKNGKIYERHSVPMLLDGELLGRVWSFRDITDKLKAETDYKNLFENSAEGIYIADITGPYIRVNPMMATMYGYSSPEEMIEMVKDPGEQLVVNPKDREIMRKALEEKGFATGIEFQTKKKNGEIFWVRNHLRLLRNNEGKPYQVEGSLEDITDRKAAQDQLVQQVEELKKVNFELDRFVYSVSHDLRAPLLSIKGLVNISEKESPNTQLMKYLDMIRISVDKLDRFIMDILDYSRNSRLEVQQDEIDFKSMINEIINNMIHMEGYQHVLFSLEVELKDKFVSDKRRIEVILGNLISNAIKYQDLKKDTQNINILITESKAHQLQLIVQDNGVGIEEASQGKIFDMFYRASDRSKGAGLGLYIIKETVDKMNGSIELESKFGEYTKFIVTIPFANMEGSDNSTPLETESPSNIE